MIRVVRLIPAHVPGITRLINAALEAAPPYWSLTDDQVSRMLRQRGSPWDMHYTDESVPAKKQQAQPAAPITMTALEGDTVLAVARVLVCDNDLTIDWIAGEDNEALKAVISRIELLAINANRSFIRCGRSLFGTGWIGIWSTWLAVRSALTISGWKVENRWRVYALEASALPGALPPAPPGFRVGWHMNKAMGEWTARGFSDSSEFASCAAWALPELLDDHPIHGQCINLEYVGVEDETQRRRKVATHLLAEQMRFQGRRGVLRAFAVIAEANTGARRFADFLNAIYVGDCLDFQWTLPDGTARADNFIKSV